MIQIKFREKYNQGRDNEANKCRVNRSELYTAIMAVQASSA